MMQKLAPDELMRRVALHEEWIRSDDQRGQRLSLQNVTIDRAVIHERTLARATFIDVEWTNCDLRRANLGSSSLERVLFQRCDLSQTMLDGCKIAELTLKQCNARALEFDSSTVDGLSIEDSDASSMIFLRALIIRAKLVDLDLHESTFRRATIEDSDLHGSNLTDVNVSRASIKRTDLRECVLDGSVWERTWLDTVQMAGARGHPKEFASVRTANVSITGAPDEALLQPGTEARLEAFLRRASSS